MKKYNFSCVQVSASGFQNLDALCNGVTIINQSNGPVYVNQVYLNASPLNVLPADRYAGESLAIGGNDGEILTGRIQISFDPALVTRPLVLIVQKYYLPG